MSSSEEGFAADGFIVHGYARAKKGGTVLYLVGRLEDGRTFVVVETRYRPNFYIRSSEAESFGRIARSAGGGAAVAAGPAATELRTLDGESCLKVQFSTEEEKRRIRDALTAGGVRTYEADLRTADQFRLEREIHGPVRIRGPGRPGRLVSVMFVDPELEPGRWQPRLSVLSLDIETEVPSEAVRAVALSHRDPWAGESERVLFCGPELDEPGVECFSGERELLLAFRERLVALDPDILTGWNVVDFDLRVLWARFAHHHLRFNLGRSREPAVYLPASEGRGSRAIVPGRQVWDGVRILRAAPESFEDYSLDTVSGALLGYGKKIELREGESRVQAIERLYRDQPRELCAYCLQDARLVHEIFTKTGLLELSIRRCLLIGVAPDLAWTSIASFEHLYTEALHRRGRVAPTYGVDALPLRGAPGGIILTPRPGLFSDVLVFDFQSLYPSIIRTFNIDPLSYVREPERAEATAGAANQASQASQAGPAGREADAAGPIRAPNGARFRREPGILPELLDRFFQGRAEAQERRDEIASFVYKIIMNSFYGVLGARGCRFAGSDLAGAVTSFGQKILTRCKSILEDEGYTVLYGDTDSLFLTAGGDSPATLDGERICRRVNEALDRWLAASYRVASRLVLRFEKRYEKFFLPPLRGVTAARRGVGEASDFAGRGAAASAKGRAKGYAGLLPGEGPVEQRIEIKGMEAVRRDWTDLAHEFQLRLLALLFGGRPVVEFRTYITELVAALHRGELDGKLVYRKALRKSLAAYTRSTPPHVKAAAFLPPSRQRGVVRYLITREGPQPEGLVSAPIDYGHYVDRQLIPIASAFLDVLNTDEETLFGRGGQLRLF